MTSGMANLLAISASSSGVRQDVSLAFEYSVQN
jgi:hypothetical protein